MHHNGTREKKIIIQNFSENLAEEIKHHCSNE